MNSSGHSVILLAAGGSRRLGRPKQLVVFEGEPLVRRVARAALSTGPAQVLLVVGAQGEDVWGAVADLPLSRVECEDWAAGLSASIRAGLDALDERIGAALFTLCDQPALRASHLQALVERWRSDPGRPAASAYAGTLGVPAVVPRTWFTELASLTGDRGARDLLRARPGEVTQVHFPELEDDLDRPVDVQRFLAGIDSAKHQR